MKSTAGLFLAVMLAASLSLAENLTQKNVERVNAIIAAAAEAHGGTPGLDALNTLIVEFEAVDFAVDQSRGTEPPWDQSETSGYIAIDLDNSVFVTRTETDSIGFQGRNGTIINADQSFQLDFRAGTAAKIAEPDYPTASGPFIRVTPALLVRTLQDRAANAHYLGDATIDSVDYEVVGFSMTVGPALSLYFEKKSHLLRRSERVLEGIGLVQYDFADYETVDGMPFNRSFRLYLNGDLNIERTNTSIDVNEPLHELLAVESGLQHIPEVEPDPLTRRQVADGVWLIGGNGTYAMFVDMGTYVFAAGGTAGIPERIASLREVVGDKPLEYGMLTHHHFDHVLGVPAYEAEGATVIVSAAHEAIARRAADNGDTIKIRTVSDRLKLESGDRILEVRDIGPTAHSEHLLVAYLPDEGILFEADHFALPLVGPIPPATTSTRTFAEALRRAELQPQKILSAHSPRVASMEDLHNALSVR